MTMTPRPHDLLWLRADSALLSVKEAWVSQHWHVGLPVVVRRDVATAERIPVGVRGERREQRAAAWVQAADILRVTTPEMLADRVCLLASPFVAYRPVQAALALSERRWPWRWGVTGNGYSGAASRQRSRFNHPRAAAAGARPFTAVAGADGEFALPRRHPG